MKEKLLILIIINQNIIDFSKFTLDLNKFDTNTITNQKTQEMKTFDLIRCVQVN